MPKAVKPIVFLVCLIPALWWLYLVWLAYQGDTDNLGPDPAKTFALESGEWSIRFLVIALAITPARYLLNAPGLWRFRRMIGLFAFFYTAIHFLVFLLLYLQLAWGDLGKEIVERPYITLGFAAFLLLLLLSLTSFNLAQRKMGRSWKRLHRAVYFAAVLAVLHMVWIVRSSFGEALFYGALVFFLLLYRLLHKLFPAVRQFSLPLPRKFF